MDNKDKINKCLEQFKEISDIAKVLRETPDTWYNDELTRLNALYRSPNGDITPAEWNSLRFQLDNVVLDLVLKMLQESDV